MYKEFDLKYDISNKKEIKELMDELDCGISKIQNGLYLGNSNTIRDISILREKNIKNAIQLINIELDDEIYYNVNILLN